jgi:hypothetical protein
MKYSVEMGSGAMIYKPSFIKICSGIQKLIGGGRYTDKKYIAKSYYGLEREARVRVPVGSSRIFSSPCSPDQLWGPPSFLSSGHRGLFFLGGKAAGA